MMACMSKVSNRLCKQRFLSSRAWSASDGKKLHALDGCKFAGKESDDEDIVEDRLGLQSLDPLALDTRRQNKWTRICVTLV